MTTILTQTLGYPRIGPQRELKRAVEAYWAGSIADGLLIRAQQDVEASGWRRQLQAGIDRIGVGDSSLYDHVLDWQIRLGLIPSRFSGLEGLDRYFSMARGGHNLAALELTKWFDSNYHYLVPEYEASSQPTLEASDFLDTVRRAQEILGERAVPIVLGPLSMVLLARLELEPQAALRRLVPAYVSLLEALKPLGVIEVQLHEPALVFESSVKLQDVYEEASHALAAVGLPLNLVTYYDDVGGNWPWLAGLPASCLSLDFTRGDWQRMLERDPFPLDKELALGVVDGRGIWRLELERTLAELKPWTTNRDLRVGASCSLEHVPYSVDREDELPPQLLNVLAFAEEKLDELAFLSRALEGDPIEDKLRRRQAAWEDFHRFAPAVPGLAQSVSQLSEGDFKRELDFDRRRPQQLSLPPFPTTTIGSFPQTAEIRSLRARLKRGEISHQQYLDRIDAWIAYAIGVQEGLGLDVLVHGEFERSDMVEYFAEKLTGFAFTRHGWVQSFGTRCVRPPIIFADITRPDPMTVREFERAQGFTTRPVKGMLTGPVTILNWSFPRPDVTRREMAFQLALALREEIADLEAAGAQLIQVDEPALREGLPFKSSRRSEYLNWAVDAFRLATAGARPSTQVHTHMCYAEFGDVMAAIDRMDADVISIENARSGDDTLRELSQYGYSRQVGPGVYDIHSPEVPSLEGIRAKLASMARHLPPDRIWVNPDCGLKTRRWHEVIPALSSLVAAARLAREGQVQHERELAGEAG